MAPLSRRRLVTAGVLGGVTALAGCVGGLGGRGGPGGESAPTPAASSDCSGAERPEPTDAAAPPREYPDAPATLTTETVGEFVVAFERAFQYNRALAEDPRKIGRLNELEVRVDDPSVETEGTRFTVSVSGDRYYRIATPDAAATPTPAVTPLPMGRGPFSASYVVTPTAVRREGTVVSCW